MRIRIMRNVLQVSWFSNAYSYEYTLVPYTRVVDLVSRFPNMYLCEYALFSLVCTLLFTHRRCCSIARPRPRTRPPWYQQFQEKLPSFDSVHDLIYQKLSAAELKGMKQTPGRKGKGSATRTTRSSKKGKKV